MRRASQIIRAADTAADSSLSPETLTLDYDSRHRRRLTLKTDGGAVILLDLAEATVLRNGDVLVCDDGSRITIRAADEALLEICCADGPALMRMAWHLGNRHLPTDIAPDRLLIRRDHVIADMVRRLGGRVAEVMAPFDPEGGAYDGAGDGGHHHELDDGVHDGG